VINLRKASDYSYIKWTWCLVCPIILMVSTGRSSLVILKCRSSSVDAIGYFHPELRTNCFQQRSVTDLVRNDCMDCYEWYVETVDMWNYGNLPID